MSIYTKKVRAVAPCWQDKGSNFKINPFLAWQSIGGEIANTHYPSRGLHGIAYKIEFPSLILDKKVAYLRFAEACSINFDCFPNYIWCETIPMIWDCWPVYIYNVAEWFRKHKVRTAIFTSSQTAKRIQYIFPDMNIMSITEGIDTKPYIAGRDLSLRDIDLLEYGRIERNFFRNYVSGINHVNVKNSNGRMQSWNKLVETMSSAKITIALPRSDTDFDFTGGIETLTQRFWEGMLSRSVLLGRAPKELIELIGYNPVITLDKNNPDKQVKYIVSHIEDYQPLVNKNRETALKMASWDIRMQQVIDWLRELGYEV